MVETADGKPTEIELTPDQIALLQALVNGTRSRDGELGLALGKDIGTIRKLTKKIIRKTHSHGTTEGLTKAIQIAVLSGQLDTSAIPTAPVGELSKSEGAFLVRISRGETTEQAALHLGFPVTKEQINDVTLPIYEKIGVSNRFAATAMVAKFERRLKNKPK